jgi:MFS family permease
MGWSWFLIPSLASRLFLDLDLTHAQYTLILTAPFLIGILSPIPGGAVGDRFGIRATIAIAAFLAGLTGIARVWAPNFETMFIVMCLFGAAYGMVRPNLPKLVKIWFPQEQAGLASGIYLNGLNLGSALGLLTGPLFGGWKPAFGTMGVLTLGLAVLWMLFARDAPQGVETRMAPMTMGIRRGIKSKNVWLVGVGQCLSLGAIVGLGR